MVSWHIHLSVVRLNSPVHWTTVSAVLGCQAYSRTLSQTLAPWKGGIRFSNGNGCQCELNLLSYSTTQNRIIFGYPCHSHHTHEQKWRASHHWALDSETKERWLQAILLPKPIPSASSLFDTASKYQPGRHSWNISPKQSNSTRLSCRISGPSRATGLTNVPTHGGQTAVNWLVNVWQVRWRWSFSWSVDSCLPTVTLRHYMNIIRTAGDDFTLLGRCISMVTFRHGWLNDCKSNCIKHENRKENRMKLAPTETLTEVRGWIYGVFTGKFGIHFPLLSISSFLSLTIPQLASPIPYYN